MSLKITCLKIVLYVYGLFKGDKFKYSQEYEDNFKYMDTEEKLWWGYKSVIRQIENPEKGKGIDKYFAEQNLNFKLEDSFETDKKITITAGGDLNASEMIFPENTKHLWDDVEGFFFSGDMVCANLETPIDVSKPASGVPPMCLTAPKLNSTPEMFEVFARGGRGINIYATANNHSLDQGESGLVATLDFLDSKGYTHVGTSRTREEQMDVPVVEKNGIKVAFLSYTYCLNGAEPIPGKEYMTNVLRLNKPDTDISLIKAQVIAARKKGADIVAAVLHWSIEFETYPIENIINMGHRIMECGVDIILGGHPHVAQPMEKYSFFDEVQGVQKEGFIIYSFGELVSLNQFSKNSRLALLAKLELSKGKIRGKEVTKISDLKVLPIHICLRKFKDGKSDYRVLDFIKTIKLIDRGENPYGFTEKEIKELKRLEKLLYNRLLPKDTEGLINEYQDTSVPR